MKYRVNRWLDSAKIREMCIRYNYYTRGDVNAYSNMLKTADNEDADNSEAVYDIAYDIYEHSDFHSDDAYAIEEKDILEGIILGLITECVEAYVDIVR